MNLKDHRCRERRETLAYWPARNVEKGEAVGLVTDISDKGMQIHSAHEFCKGDVFTIRIDVDPDLAGADHIKAVVENVWCRASGVPGLYHTGFRIVDISEEERQHVLSLVSAFSYRALANEQRKD